ncbi:hypothetical protein O181_036286 [Austropuccinia psidii MF-1]|uniref:Uncharacterized protein n=1 Tax=Austropuccinia psidii MF-1 TaxID=1389203 RepID=A0A9Q3H9S8_9BASI|nr:hypothetical protein [Austropuccinia psidii MF-1]
MSPVHLRNLGIPRNQPEDREGLFRTRRTGRGHLGHSAPPTPQRSIPIEHGQQEVQPSIKLGITWSKLPEDMFQNNALQRPYGNHQSMESQQAVQTPGKEGNQDKVKSSHYPSYRRTA